MAGYLINLDSMDSLRNCISQGFYSTQLRMPKVDSSGNGYWGAHQEGTFADYCTMKPGDNIYFFIKRMIYGVGELIPLKFGKCSFCNYLGSSVPNNSTYDSIRPSLLSDSGPERAINHRWICFFRPSPAFFRNGVDMDEMLMAYPGDFKMLRAFWKLSFIKFTDRENMAFKDVILKKNEQYILDSQSNSDGVYPNCSAEYHACLDRLITENHLLSPIPILRACKTDNKIGHEMALEAGLLFQLSHEGGNAIEIFGQWDYLSHQVIASPFKPIEYMDKMDVFGYRFVRDYGPTISKFLVCELKKDEVTIDNVDQIMKYIDWVKQEYAHGDYSMVEAFLVGGAIPETVREHARSFGIRQFTKGSRPVSNCTWRNLNLVQYNFIDESGLIQFQRL